MSICGVDLFGQLLLAIRQSGVIAFELQGRVANEGKVDMTTLPNDSYALRARRAAKTAVDEIIQEVIILAAADAVDPRHVALDAEESTPSYELFTGSRGNDPTLVVDPIDGTLEYLQGQKSYSICAAMTHHGKLSMAFVYFPAYDELYYLDHFGRPRIAIDVRRSGINASRLVEARLPVQSHTVFVNGRVPQSVTEALSTSGYDVIDDTEARRGVRGCMLACLHGEAVAYLAHTRQMRDILLGGLIGATKQGYALDWRGAALQWPPGGRVATALFGVGQLPQQLLDCLAMSEVKDH